MRARIIAVDIDGTLLNPSREITPRTLNACKRVMDAGAKLVLSSGRMPRALYAIGRALRVNSPAVCYNGGAVCDLYTGDMPYKTPLELPLAREIALEAERMGLYLHAFVKGGYIAPEYNRRTMDYEKLCGVKANVALSPISEAMDEAPMKLLILDEPDAIDIALPALRERFGERATLVKSQAHMIECVGKLTSKASALEFLCGRLGVTPAEAIAFGDGQNDLDMLMWAGESYVMANASDGVKRASPRFRPAPSNAEDGVAQVLEACLSQGRIGG